MADRVLDMDKMVSIKGLVIRTTPVIPDMKTGMVLYAANHASVINPSKHSFVVKCAIMRSTCHSTAAKSQSLPDALDKLVSLRTRCKLSTIVVNLPTSRLSNSRKLRIMCPTVRRRTRSRSAHMRSLSMFAKQAIESRSPAFSEVIRSGSILDSEPSRRCSKPTSMCCTSRKSTKEDWASTSRPSNKSSPNKSRGMWSRPER